MGPDDDGSDIALTGTFPGNSHSLSVGFGNTENDMLRWALIFLVIGLIAGVLGFTGVAGTSIAIAKILFFIFLAIFLVLMIAGFTVARKVSGD
jgi:uncharacterized membrane protein YtjA (UPF0391 family)